MIFDMIHKNTISSNYRVEKYVCVCKHVRVSLEPSQITKQFKMSGIGNDWPTFCLFVCV